MGMMRLKTIIKTIILSAFIVLGLFIGLNVYNKSHAILEESTRNDLALTDPTVLLLMNKVNGSNLFHDASFSSDRIDEEFVIHYTIDNLAKEDYSTKVVEHKKSLCEVTGKILFTSTSDCNIRIIKNDVFSNKVKNDFHKEIELSYPNFNYKGYFCKNDGKRYYCLMSKYQETIKNFSVLKEAYEEDDKIIIYEYYLFVDLNDKDSCYLYLNKDYCDKKNVNEEIIILDDIIKDNGILYRHEFVREEEQYYYLQSFVVSER